MSATLYIVSTPIGNLEDITQRALRVLGEVDLIVAENTRHSLHLLNHYGITTPLLSLHEHNEANRIEPLLIRLKGGESIAQISDAGTPLISDPGYRLAAAARTAGLEVTAVPGASAPLMALTLSTLPVDRFCFEGFLPARATARRSYLERLSQEQRTMIFLDSPRRVVESLREMAALFGGDRRVALCRELTKLHETIHLSPLDEAVEWLQQEPNRLRGEFVLVLAGAEAGRTEHAEAERITRLLARELPPGKAAALAAEITGASRKQLYRMLLK